MHRYAEFIWTRNALEMELHILYFYNRWHKDCFLLQLFSACSLNACSQLICCNLSLSPGEVAVDLLRLSSPVFVLVPCSCQCLWYLTALHRVLPGAKAGRLLVGLLPGCSVHVLWTNVHVSRSWGRCIREGVLTGAVIMTGEGDDFPF